MNGAIIPELFALDHVDASYGPFRALFDLSFALGAGRALALLGANGAGKTTVARVCSGLLAPTSGTVTFDGADVTGRPAHDFARRGISHAPEGRAVFATLTVEENLSLGFRAALGAKGVAGALAETFELFPKLGDRRRQLAGSLSGGEQRMLSLSSVLVNPPKLMIVDELSLGLAPIIVDEVYRHLAAIKAKGTALLVIEQHVEHALDLADDVIVLTRGEITYHGPVLAIDELADHLLPGAADPAAPSRLDPDPGDSDRTGRSGATSDTSGTAPAHDAATDHDATATGPVPRADDR